MAIWFAVVVDLKEVKKEWLASDGQHHIRDIANHYGVFEHLFGKYAYFVPRVPLNVNVSTSQILDWLNHLPVKFHFQYSVDETNFLPVYYGNLIKPSEAVNQPEVTFDSTINLTVRWNGMKIKQILELRFLLNFHRKTRKRTRYGVYYWQILMVTTATANRNTSTGLCTIPFVTIWHFVQLIIAFSSNIPNGDVSKGETIVPYIQPFPVKGTGYHRHIFVLYKQERKLDFSKYKVNKL